MQPVVRHFLTTVLVLGGVVGVSMSWAMATAIPLLVAHTTALIMGGTSHPLIGPKDDPVFVTSYLDSAVNRHLNPAFTGAVTNAVAVFTPEELFPIGRLTLNRSVEEGLANLHRCLAASAGCVFNDDAAVVPASGPSAAPQIGDAMMVFGFSQSSIIASLAKSNLIGDYQAGDPAVPFMLVANPMRPNGGVLMRGLGLPTIPILDISFLGASPTDSAMPASATHVYPTVDIARQYDGLGGDFPVRPLNLLALANSLLGYGLLHGETIEVPFERARYQGREGDTSYYLVETDLLPILQPLAFLVPTPILQAIDAPLRVIIEDAYDRGVGPGTPTPLSWRPIEDPVGLTENVLRSIPVAIDNLFEGFGLSRVLGTEAPGPYGVGGPDLPDEPGDAPLALSLPAPEADTPNREPGDADQSHGESAPDADDGSSTVYAAAEDERTQTDDSEASSDTGESQARELDLGDLDLGDLDVGGTGESMQPEPDSGRGSTGVTDDAAEDAGDDAAEDAGDDAAEDAGDDAAEDAGDDAAESVGAAAASDAGAEAAA